MIEWHIDIPIPYAWLIKKKQESVTALTLIFGSLQLTWTNAFCILALVENMDLNGDGFASQSEVESFGLKWKGDVEEFDLNGKSISCYDENLRMNVYENDWRRFSYSLSQEEQLCQHLFHIHFLICSSLILLSYVHSHCFITSRVYY